MDHRAVLLGAVMGSAVWSTFTTQGVASSLLSETEIAEQLESLPNWTTDGQRLTCTFEFANFVESVAFVNSLVDPAEAIAHHPDLHISYNRVTVSLTTHDAGGLTPLDVAMASAIARPCPTPTP